MQKPLTKVKELPTADEHRSAKDRLVEKAEGLGREPGSYVTYGPAGIERIACKCCGKTLRFLMPDARYRDVQRINGQTVIYERLFLQTHPDYREVELVFEDGSKHVTIVCKDCAVKIKPEDYDWHYMTDVVEMAREAGPRFPWRVFDRGHIASHEVLTPFKAE